MPEVTDKARIFIHSHFAADPFGHGGNKRTSQIKGILQRSTESGLIKHFICFPAVSLRLSHCDYAAHK
ncbi:hypothetical protein GCM10027037_23990 [Mucilaginibacter koreensis]